MRPERPPRRRPTRRHGVLALALATAALMGRGAPAGELFRCGSWVVTPEMSVAELRQKCGEPTKRAVETQDVYARAAGGGTVKTGTATVEHWFYERSRSLTMIVTITDGEITGMETAR